MQKNHKQQIGNCLSSNGVGLITRRVQQDSFNHEGQCCAVQIKTIRSHVQEQTNRLHMQVQTKQIVHCTHNQESNMIQQVIQESRVS
jgi:hypothetical protein